MTSPSVAEHSYYQVASTGWIFIMYEKRRYPPVYVSSCTDPVAVIGLQPAVTVTGGVEFIVTPRVVSI